MLICGIDEVGRGALAGPLIAIAAVFTPQKWTTECFKLQKSPIPSINDSKKLSASKREELFHQILNEQCLVDFGIGEISVNEIDEVGIEQANKRAFRRALSELSVIPNYLIVDGENDIYGWGGNQLVEPKADEKYWPVAAASILAKVIRDDLMREYDKDYPKYNFAENSGYGTEYHKNALQVYGPCPLHRSQFIRRILGTSNASHI